MNRHHLNALRLFVWSVLLFATTFWLHTRHNDFPYYYHTDEPGKVEQMLGKRPLNFHHPLLLLNTARLFSQGVQSNQQAVEIGRDVSAGFTAAAVVALSLMAYVWRGWIMMVAVGLVLAAHHQLFELSHYFKEDTAMLFGVGVTFLALHLFDRRPGLRTAAFVGLGAGLAISGKVAGALVLVPVVLVLISRRAKNDAVPDELPIRFATPLRRGATALLVTMAVVLLVTFLVINLQMISSWGAARASLSREENLVTSGQGLTQKIPHSKYWNVFLTNTTPVIWLLILVAFWSAWHRRRQLRMVEWTTMFFPVFVALVLSFLPKDNDRYFLPATALFVVLAAMGAGEVRSLLPPALRQYEFATETIAATLMLAAQLPGWTEERGGLLRYWVAFQEDDNASLVEFLRRTLPPNAVVAKDDKVRLPDPANQREGSAPLPFKILSDEYVADLSPDGTVEGLAKIASYVVITDSTFGKFERADLIPKGNGAADYDRRKSFYANLRGDSAAIRDWPRRTVIYLHPGFEVYHIQAP